MKLFQFNHREDYGHDCYVTFVVIKQWCLIQSCFSTMVYGRSWPYLNIAFGSGRLFSFNFQVWNVGICIELISRSWFIDS